MKKFFSVIFATIFMVQNVMADNLSDVVNAWKMIYSTIQGGVYSVAEGSTVIDFTHWERAIKNAYSELNDSVTLTIKDFNPKLYDLELIKSYDVAISAKGAITGMYSEITYYFDYNPNYRMIRAAEDRSLYKKLSLEEKQVFTALNQVVNDIKKTNYTDYEKEVAIHDFIVSTYEYGPTDVTEVPQRAHSIVGMVTDGYGICEAYATTFQLMCRMAGIESQIVTGEVNGVGHMWNIVKIDGDYYHVDVTNDDPYINSDSSIIYNYFNVTDDMLSSNHTWDKTVFPTCNSTLYNYHVYNGLLVSSYEDLEKLLNDGLAKGQTYFTFRTEGYVLNNADDVRKILSNKGFSQISVSGEYGRDGLFNIALK